MSNAEYNEAEFEKEKAELEAENKLYGELIKKMKLDYQSAMEGVGMPEFGLYETVVRSLITIEKAIKESK